MVKLRGLLHKERSSCLLVAEEGTHRLLWGVLRLLGSLLVLLWLLSLGD